MNETPPMQEPFDELFLCQQTEEEKLLKEENIPGLTICGQEHELEFLQQLSEHFDNLNKESESENEEGEISENVPILPNNEEKETEAERKIRLGEMTPFGTVLKANNTSASESQIMKYLQQQEDLKAKFKSRNTKTTKVVTSHKNSTPPKPRKKILLGTDTVEYTNMRNHGPMLSEKMTVDFNESSGSEYVPSSDGDSEPEEMSVSKKKSLPSKKRKRKKSDSLNEGCASESDTPCSSKSVRIRVQKELDDGDAEQYERRIEEYEKSYDTTKIMFYEFNDDHFKIPLEVWSKLYNYQKVGVQWLWELHQQGVGGILADEMGLGKTIQLITFLSGLFYSKLLNRHTNVRGLGPVLIVCPTTLMYQWVKEFHIWFPPVRVAIFHSCGSFSNSARKKSLIKDVWRGRGVLITSYAGMMQHSDELLRYSWHYAILDEGHKIRNPDAKVTLAVKQLKTPHRIILSGSPLQNNLEELWSLFDFIYPGKLGALPLFQAQFAVPITHGGYANATDTEVTIAYKCATVLKELIAPYLLRRTKTDVKSHIKLPEKNEQILFCQLTDVQRNLYKTYIDSGVVQRIIEGQAQIFAGIINLRKICNHPDLFTGGPKLLKHEKESDLPEEERFGFWKKSGKMIVLETLLKIWQKQKHKVLLFTQSKKMLMVLELFLKTCNYTFLKLDGGTYIGSRQPLIDQFNKDPDYFIMLLTTKVGGLGVNLTGANRVVIFDPDWNPATDTQARERAWRIGQTQDVTVYRLISVGTIEEKMYHRQIFKQFLTNKVLKDPKQRRFFKSNDLFELFTLKESSEEGSTETGAIFAGTGSEINKRILEYKEKLKKKRLRQKAAEAAITPLQFSKSKIEKMKLIAQQISQKLAQQVNTGRQSATDAVEKVTPQKPPEEVTLENPRVKINEEIVNMRRHKKKKHKRSFFEGERVPNLVSCRKAHAKVENEEEGNEVKAVEDEYVLKKLFSKAGICSALQHDTIMNGGPADFAIVEKEAAKIADEAIKELKRSQEECFPAHTGIPNWTGKNGKLAKTKCNANVLSSSDILAKIKKRNGMLEATSTETELLKSLRKFIMSEGGTAKTDRLVQTFQQELPASQTPLFKCLLNKVCTFYRGPDKKGYWTLKTEYL